MQDKTIIIILFLIVSLSGFAQIRISAEIRPRAEYRQGYKSLLTESEKPAFLITQRSRLNFHHIYKGLETFFSIQDCRIWGQDLLRTSIPSLSLHEAWFNIPIYDSLRIKAGRQQISYDNDKFFSAINWIMPGLKHDAVIFSYKFNTTKLFLGAAFNQSADRLSNTYYHFNQYKTLNYLRLEKSFGESSKISAMWVGDSFEKPGMPQTVYLRSTWMSMFT